MPPTPQVAEARRYAARVRILLACTGGFVLAEEPGLQTHPLPAALGCGVIGLTGLFELLVSGERWLGIEEGLSCLAAVGIVGLGEGRVTAMTLLWLTAAAVGVLARGGRAGRIGRVLVTGALLAPLILGGRITAQEIALLVSALTLLLAVGRVSRETARLLQDPLTQAVSRAAFRAQVDRVAARARPERPAALILVDFDDFGAVNKDRGHAAGDEVLRDAAHAMQQALRPGDVLGRLGGDEFAVLSDHGDPVETARSIILGAAGAGVGACAGVARCPRDGVSAEALLGAADLALRVSKRAGKRRVTLYEGASLSAGDPRGARAALERLCAGEGMEVVLEPILDLRSGRVHAYEAMLCFDVEGRGAPLQWLTLADTLGLRADLETACLRCSLPVLATLPRDVRMFVNLSPATLVSPNVQSLLGTCPQAGRLVLQIGQQRMLDADPGLVRSLALLRARGLAVAVAGLGAGHADLGQLAVIAPDYIRLDRSLLRNAESEPARALLLGAVIAHAGSCGWHVIAGGIETAQELAAARVAGAAFGQGPELATPPGTPAGGATPAQGRAARSTARAHPSGEIPGAGTIVRPFV